MNMNEHTVVPSKVPLILLVEDDWVINGLIQDILEFEGFKVHAVDTADEAWQFLLADSCQVDLIFSDIHFPGLLSGIDLANLTYGRWPHLPIILSSGSRYPQPLASGCSPVFVSKPWHSMAIGAVCRHVLARRPIRGIANEHIRQ
jgi:CheY-like chemotaxis protein